MSEEKKLRLDKVREEDLDALYDLIYGLALYEKRPEDRTGTKEELVYWLFRKEIATALLLKVDETLVGYALYYPVFGSFSCKGGVHLEDLFLLEQYRGQGLGKAFFPLIASFIKAEGYAKMEWSCLDWNLPSIRFYQKLEAKEETGRVYFEYPLL